MVVYSLWVGRISWSLLSRLGDSFFSKSVTLISLMAFLLSNNPWMHWIFPHSMWKLWILFLGALFFVVGHVCFLLSIPLELRGYKSLVAPLMDMMELHSESFFKSRLKMFKSRVNRLNIKYSNNNIVRASSVYLSQMPDQFNSEDELRGFARILYTLDLGLLDISRPIIRITCAFLMLTGVFLLSIPMILNVLQAFKAGLYAL